jgi:hypothetical protein
MAVFWDIAPCSIVEIGRRFRGVYCLHHQGDDGDGTHLWNVSIFQRDYTALYPRILSSSFLPPPSGRWWRQYAPLKRQYISTRLQGAISQNTIIFILASTIRAMMGTVRTSETSVYFNETTRRYIPEHYLLQTCRHENLNFMFSYVKHVFEVVTLNKLQVKQSHFWVKNCGVLRMKEIRIHISTEDQWS